jgi:hypothetical protein
MQAVFGYSPPKTFYSQSYFHPPSKKGIAKKLFFLRLSFPHRRESMHINSTGNPEDTAVVLDDISAPYEF